MRPPGTGNGTRPGKGATKSSPSRILSERPGYSRAQGNRPREQPGSAKSDSFVRRKRSKPRESQASELLRLLEPPPVSKAGTMPAKREFGSMGLFMNLIHLSLGREAGGTNPASADAHAVHLPKSISLRPIHSPP